MLRAVTITGTRSTDHRTVAEYRAMFENYLRPFADPGVRFHLGGASGIDSLALLWLAGETEAELVVVVPAKLTDQPGDARHAVEGARETGRLAKIVELGGQTRTLGYHARNRWMVDRSQMTIGFPHAASGGGTWYTLDYTASQDKPRLIVPV